MMIQKQTMLNLSINFYKFCYYITEGSMMIQKQTMLNLSININFQKVQN